MVVDDVFKMGDVSDGNCSINNHNLYQQDFDSNNGDVRSVYGFINSHTLSQCDDTSTFKDIGGYVENFDVSSECGSMNSHTFFKYNCSK